MNRKSQESREEVRDLIKRLGTLFEQYRSFQEQHKHVIVDLIREKGYEEDLQNLSISELHTIDCIGNHPESNLTTIAELTGLTKSAISKISVRLHEKNLIETFRKPHNKKEVLFGLTEAGRAIHGVHQQFHESRDRRLLNRLKKYGPAEREAVRRFLDDLLSEMTL